MEIRKDERLKTHRRVAVTTGAFLTVILGVTILGMAVFSPSSGRNGAIESGSWRNPVANVNAPPLIGSHVAQAAPVDTDATNTKIKEGLDSVANKLDEIVEDARDSESVLAEGTAEAQRGGGTEEQQGRTTVSDNVATAEGGDDAVLTLRQKDDERVADAGLSIFNVWRVLWDMLWPKVKAVSGLIWSTVSSPN